MLAAGIDDGYLSFSFFVSFLCWHADLFFHDLLCSFHNCEEAFRPGNFAMVMLVDLESVNIQYEQKKLNRHSTELERCECERLVSHS